MTFNFSSLYHFHPNNIMEVTETHSKNTENPENFTIDHLKSLLTQAQLENTDLKSKLAIVHELLRRYKLNEVTDLNKQLV